MRQRAVLARQGNDTASGPPVKPGDDGRGGSGGAMDRRRFMAGIEGAAGTIVEVSPAATAIMATIAGRIAADGGAALIIDYGYEGPATGDTLQAVRRHHYDDPLSAPGEADPTAHVDFAALAGGATEAGAKPRPLLTQGTFLRRLGLAERAERLGRGKSDADRDLIRSAAERLAGSAAMGELFKVLAVATPGLALPVFDDDVS